MESFKDFKTIGKATMQFHISTGPLYELTNINTIVLDRITKVKGIYESLVASL